MNSIWNFIDHAPILDLLYLSVLSLFIAALLTFAALTLYRERQYRLKRERLLELYRRDKFDEDHSHRPRVGR